MNDKVLNYTSVKSYSFYKLLVYVFIFVGLSCFTLSLFLPTFFTSGEDIYGYWVLVTGWMGLIFIQLAWYANPINLLSLLLAKEKPRVALLLSFCALILASEAFLFYEIPTGLNYEKVFIKEFGLGFYLWFLAQIFVLFALFIHFLDSLRKH